MSVLISAKVATFYCQPVSQFQVQHWKNLTPLINWWTPWHKLTRVPQAQAKVLLPICPPYPNRIPTWYSPAHRTQVTFGLDTLGEDNCRCPRAEPSHVPSAHISLHTKDTAAVTHSGPLPWLHSDWKLQWGHTRMSLLLGHRQTQTCSNPWKETQKYQYTNNYHFLGTEEWHHCCSAAQGPDVVSVKNRLVNLPTQGRSWQKHQALPEGLEGGVE